MGLTPKVVYDHRRDGAPTEASIARSSPYFTEISNELADKGFLVTSTDELINWARTGSLMWMTFGLACCAVETMTIEASMRRAAIIDTVFSPWQPLLAGT